MKRTGITIRDRWDSLLDEYNRAIAGLPGFCRDALRRLGTKPPGAP